MSVLAEAIVEEWLNRQGYFTIRGLKLGVDEIDLLAIKPRPQAIPECRHLEVQASVRPISYISRVPKRIQRETGKAPNSAKRDADELRDGVREWVQKKFLNQKKLRLMGNLCPGAWTKELVIHKVKSAAEVRMIEGYGVTIHHLSDVVSQLKRGVHAVQSAAGGDLLELVQLGAVTIHEPEGGRLSEAEYNPRGGSDVI